MKTILPLIILCFGLLHVVYSQTLTGRIYDENRKPIAYANVLLIARQDSTFVQGVIADSVGRYTLMQHPALANLFMRVACIGYKTKDLDLRRANVDEIVLQENLQEIDEAVVVAQRKPMSMGAHGELLFNIRNTPLGKETNSLELIKKLPGIMGQGEQIKSFMGGEVVVYINNRKIRSLDELKRLQPQDIQTVEINTNTQAEYGATTGSVIRIVTKRRRDEWFLLLDSRLRQNHYFSHDNALTVGIQHKRVYASGMLEYSDYRRKDIQELLFEHRDNTDLWSYRGVVNGLSWSVKELNAMCDVEFELSPTAALGIKYDGAFENSAERQATPFQQSHNGVEIDNLIGKNDEKATSNRHYFNAYCQWRPTGKIKGELYLDYIKAAGKAKQTVNDGNLPDTEIDRRNNNELFAALLKSEFILSERIGFVGGVEHTSVNVYTDTHYSTPLIGNTDARNTEQKVSGFVKLEYTGEAGLSGYLGLRDEFVWSTYNDKLKLPNNQRIKDNVILPSLGLAWRHASFSHSLSYGLRLVRPSFTILNGSTAYLNQFFYQESNPRLKSQYNHRIQYQFQYKNFNLASQYQLIRDAIQMELFEAEGGRKGIKSTFSNIPINSSLQIMGSYTHTIGLYTLSASLGGMQNWVNVSIQEKQKVVTQPFVYIQLDNDFAFSKHFGFDCDFVYVSKATEGFMKVKPSYVLNARLYFSFYDNALQLSLRCRDILDSNRSFYYGHSLNIYIENKNFSDFRSLLFNIRWRFNQRKKYFGGEAASEDDINRL